VPTEENNSDRTETKVIDEFLRATLVSRLLQELASLPAKRQERSLYRKRGSGHSSAGRKRASIRNRFIFMKILFPSVRHCDFIGSRLSHAGRVLARRTPDFLPLGDFFRSTIDKSRGKATRPCRKRPIDDRSPLIF
jgi:hypothetical protein